MLTCLFLVSSRFGTGNRLKKKIRRETFHPSKTAYDVFSRHFEENYYHSPNENTPSMFRKKGLRKNAIPSLYLRGEEQAQEK